MKRRLRPSSQAALTTLVLLTTGHAALAQTATWICTTADRPWVTTSIDAASPVPSPPESQKITIDPKTTYQTIDGFGGCFNETGWKALSALPDAKRASIMQALFDSKVGCRFTFGRMPIGASDFGLDWYSLDDTPGDYELKYFTIHRDEGNLIPFIHAAMKYAPKLQIWGSAWSPPAWLKNNNDYHGGDNTIKQDPQTLSVYAHYLAKYVQAYQKVGIHVYAVHVQNEPASTQNFPSCQWTGKQEQTFISDYLGPRFAADNVKAQIWLGTINDGDINHYAVPVLSDPDAAKYVSGIGYQWAGKDAIGPTHDKYPSYRLMQTETECGGGENNWESAVHTWGLLDHYLTNWANSYMYWNMVLDQNSVSSWGWKQNAMVTVHTDTQTVTYNPEFYVMKHFSACITPGAKRIEASGADNVLAFRNPDGTIVVVAANLGNSPKDASLQIAGKTFSATLPQQSFNTFTYRLKRH